MWLRSSVEKSVWPCIKFSAALGSPSPEFVAELIVEGRRIAQQSANLLSMQERINLIADWAFRWRDPFSAWRKRARLLLPESVPFSRPMIEICLDLFFRTIKRELLEDLSAKFPARRPELVGHILPSNVLAASAESLVYELVLGNINIVKASSRNPVFPLLVVETLSEMDPRLKQYISLVCWKGGDEALDRALVCGLDRLIVYGTQETIEHVKTLAPGQVTLDIYSPGSAVGVIEKEWTGKKFLLSLARRAALDVSIYDQRGCLSLQTIFVETGGEFSAQDFAKELAKALRELEDEYPLGELTVRDAAAVRLKRNRWSIKEISGKDVFQVGDERIRFTVLYEPHLCFDEPICGRMVTVRPFSNLSELSELFDRCNGMIQGLALADLSEVERWRDKRVVRLAEFGTLHATMIGWQKLPFGSEAVTIPREKQ